MVAAPTERTLRECRRRGWRAGVVERWMPKREGMAHSLRIDLFGFIDVIVYAPGARGVLGVQATSTSNIGARVAKVTRTAKLREAAIDWLRTGCHFEVWGWAKRGPSGKRKLWTLRRVALRLHRGELRTVEVVST